MIFISFHNASESFAVDLRKKLQDERSLVVWMFTSDLRGGDNWQAVIDNAIDQCVAMIVVVTPEAIKSEYVIYEWSRALGQGKKVIPLIVKRPDPDNPEHRPIHPRMAILQDHDINRENFSWQRFLDEVNEVEKTEAIPPLVVSATMALFSSNNATRNDGINTLLYYDHPTAVAARVDAIEVPFADLSIRAALALTEKTNYQDEHLVRGLANAMSEKWHNSNLWPQILTALEKIDTDEALKSLEEGLSRKDNHRQSEIVEALCRMKNPDSSRVLLAWLESGHDQKKIIDTLGERRYRFAVPVFADLLNKLNQSDLNRVNRLHLIQALAKIEGKDSVDAIFAVVETNVKSRSGVDGQVVDAAIKALTDIGNDYVAELLQHALAESKFRKYHFTFQGMINSIRYK